MNGRLPGALGRAPLQNVGTSLVVVVTDRPGLRSETARGNSTLTNGWTLEDCRALEPITFRAKSFEAISFPQKLLSPITFH